MNADIKKHEEKTQRLKKISFALDFKPHFSKFPFKQTRSKCIFYKKRKPSFSIFTLKQIFFFEKP